MEGDAWVISFTEVENRLLTGGCRRKVLSIMKALRDNHLELPGNPITSYILKTLVLYECEKHPREFEWDESAVGDRLNGILLQLISCLQCKRCPHYFLPTLDLFKGKSPTAMENASKQVWRLLRELLTNTRAFEKLWNCDENLSAFPDQSDFFSIKRHFPSFYIQERKSVWILFKKPFINLLSYYTLLAL